MVGVGGVVAIGVGVVCASVAVGARGVVVGGDVGGS